MKLLLGKIEKYKSKSTIVSPTISDLDVFTCIEEESCFFVNYLVVREGAIIHAYTNQIIKKLNENKRPISEHNWVWNPTGVIDMHVPVKWGYLYFKN